VKVLLDEDLDHRLRKRITAHEVFTVRYLGWSGLENGDLLTTAEQNGIDVFVTADQNLSYQQNLSGRRMAVVVLSATNWPIIKNHIEAISAAIDRATPGSFQEVECGRFSRKRQQENQIEPELEQENEQEQDRDR
jgi:predicted nuclease of predicted toxin-antitoxin system